MSDCRPLHLRTRNADTVRQISALRVHFGDSLASNMLGLTIYGLNSPRQSIPVQRLAAILHRLTFHPGEPFTVFDLLTSGRYAERLAIRSNQGVNSIIVVSASPVETVSTDDWSDYSV